MFRNLSRWFFFTSLVFFHPTEFPLIVTILAMIGKSAMAASFSTTYLFSAELFPTVVR